MGKPGAVYLKMNLLLLAGLVAGHKNKGNNCTLSETLKPRRVGGANLSKVIRAIFSVAVYYCFSAQSFLSLFQFEQRRRKCLDYTAHVM